MAENVLRNGGLVKKSKNFFTAEGSEEDFVCKPEDLFLLRALCVSAVNSLSTLPTLARYTHTSRHNKYSNVKIDPATSLIDEADFIESPNVDARPDDHDIDLIVIHSISLPPGEFGGPWIEKLFTNQLPADKHPYFEEINALQVSAHALIMRDGTVKQFVPFDQRAWHAGESCYQGRETCNDYSIGIELEGTDDSDFADIQYEKLAELIVSLEQTYPGISRQRLTGHSDIAPGRKTDPGTGFDWFKLKKLLG